MDKTPSRNSEQLEALARSYDAGVTAEVIHRTQVGACIPFTVLPKHYLGKKVRIVIDEGADD